MKRLLQLVSRAAALVAVSALLAAGVNLIRPSGRLAWVEDWSLYIEAKALKAGLAIVNLTQTQELLAGGKALVFDARPSADYEDGHIPGSQSLPFDSVNEDLVKYQAILTRETPILAYCSGEECDDALELVVFLGRQGFTNLAMFAEGYTAWSKANLPIEKGAAP